MPEHSSPKQLVISLLVVLGALALLRDLLQLSDRLSMAAELELDPGGIHREIAEHLQEDET